MTELTQAAIMQAATEVKGYVEQNRTLPIFITVSGTLMNQADYLRLLTVTTVKMITGDKSNTPTGGYNNPDSSLQSVTAGILLKDEYVAIAKRVTDFLDGATAPRYGRSSLGNIGFSNLVFTFSRILSYYGQKGTIPANVTVTQFNCNPGTNATADNIDDDGVYTCKRFRHNIKQNTNYYCAPFMSAQLLYELYNIDVAQAWLAGQEGTTEDGTGHSGINAGINAAAKKYGHTVTINWYNFSSTTWKGIAEAVEALEDGLGTHGLYRNKWGHYMFIVYVNLNTKVVGIIDSLNDDNDILYVDFDTFGQWLKNTPYNQPAMLSVKKES